jgi:hypothetical protein
MVLNLVVNDEGLRSKVNEAYRVALLPGKPQQQLKPYFK